MLKLRKNHGAEEQRARDLFYALWVPDLFMERVRDGAQWTLFSPDTAPGLATVSGERFVQLYERYEREGRGVRTMAARELMSLVVVSQVETGTPYMLYKDTCNARSNQRHLGTIQSSNLCCVTGDQRVPTATGLRTVRELYAEGCENVVAGRDKLYRATPMRLLRRDQPVLRVETREGYTHTVTADHKLWKCDVGWTRADELRAGDCVEMQQIEGPWIGGDKGPEYAYDWSRRRHRLPGQYYSLLGYLTGFVASGRNVERRLRPGDDDVAVASLSGSYFALAASIGALVHGHAEETGYRSLCGDCSQPIEYKYDDYCEALAADAPAERPVLRRECVEDLRAALAFYDIEVDTLPSRLPESVWCGGEPCCAAFLGGLFDACGAVATRLDNAGARDDGLHIRLVVPENSRQLLTDVQTLLANYAVPCSIVQTRRSAAAPAPPPQVHCMLIVRGVAACTRLVKHAGVSGAFLRNETPVCDFRELLRFDEPAADAEELRRQRRVCVERVVPLEHHEDVYCLEVLNSSEHAWTANGLVTKNCEIVQYSSADEIAVCNLCSVALPKFAKFRPGSPRAAPPQQAAVVTGTSACTASVSADGDGGVTTYVIDDDDDDNNNNNNVPAEDLFLVIGHMTGCRTGVDEPGLGVFANEEFRRGDEYFMSASEAVKFGQAELVHGIEKILAKADAVEVAEARPYLCPHRQGADDAVAPRGLVLRERAATPLTEPCHALLEKTLQREHAIAEAASGALQSAVPDCVWKAPRRRCVERYLEGLYGMCGTIDGTRRNCRVRLVHNSCELLRDVQVLLTGFGVRSGVEQWRPRYHEPSLMLDRSDTDDGVRLISAWLPRRPSPGSSPGLWALNVRGHEECGRLFDSVRALRRVVRNESPYYDTRKMTTRPVELGAPAGIAAGAVRGVETAAAARAWTAQDWAERRDRTQEVLASFDFDGLAALVRLCVRNLNKVIDNGQYPFDELVARADRGGGGGGGGGGGTVANADAQVAGAPPVPFDKCRRSNERHRPMSIGVQGLADVFAELRVAYDSAEARELNRRIFECMYYAALSESCALAERGGAPHESYAGSPVSRGELQFDAWPGGAAAHCHATMFDWAALRERIARHGVRNSLLIGLMPTASTSQILGNTESFEPPTSNLYARRTLGGEFVVPNRRMVEQLDELGLWDERMQETLQATRGSLQRVSCVPRALRDVFKTAFEVKMRDCVDAAADRGAFVDQSQSFNVHMGGDVASLLGKLHMYTWRKGLKTGMYYLRSEPAMNALAVTNRPELVHELDPEAIPSLPPTPGSEAAPPPTAAAVVGATAQPNNDGPAVVFEGAAAAAAPMCRLDDPGCESCGS